MTTIAKPLNQVRVISETGAYSLLVKADQQSSLDNWGVAQEDEDSSPICFRTYNPTLNQVEAMIRTLQAALGKMASG